MGHKASYWGRIEVENNHVYRILRAEWGTDPETQEVLYSLDVFRECLETGECQARNVHFTGLGGWLVDFPGEKVVNRWRGYKTSYIQDLENWWNTDNYSGFGYSQNEMSMTTVKIKILQVHPELKYLMKKILIPTETESFNQFQYSQLFNIIRCYWKHPESETLFQLGCFQLAMNENLYRLTKSKLKQVLAAITEMKNKNELFDIQLKDIQKYWKYYSKDGMSFTEWYSYWCWDDMETSYVHHWGWEVYKYCMKKNISKYEYRDYLDMAEKLGHDINDLYWKYPNDFRKAHDKLMEQQKETETAKLMLQQEFLKPVLKPMLKYNSNVDGYDIFISTEASEWVKTCDALYQCLIRNGYMKKVIEQEEIIVFIWKDGVPQATAQVFYDKKLGQFYGDERGHREGKSCEPSDEIKAAFSKWLSTFKPKKAKFNADTSMHYYKGFTDKVENGFHTGFGNMDGNGKGSTFIIGNTYETNFDDETIISTGRNCVATNKVFHFCSSITEISNHYCPKYYAEVKPLGPVVENNGALLTNKIEIVREIPESEIARLIDQEKSLKQINI